MKENVEEAGSLWEGWAAVKGEAIRRQLLPRVSPVWCWGGGGTAHVGGRAASERDGS